MTSLVCKLNQGWKRFRDDASGAVLFYITATLPALIGMSLLAIDASRVMSLHTSLQKGADSLAIAAAGELDRTPGAMQRANLAVANLVSNTQIFGTSLPAIDQSNVTLRFFSAIPADDSTAMPVGGPTLLDESVPADDLLARYVEVTTDPHNMDTIFPASFIGVGGANSATSSATAVAGNDSVVCKLMPLFICNPYEQSGNLNVHEVQSILTGVSTRASRRKQIRMRVGPGGGGYGPGNYGFLIIDQPGANVLEKALAFGSPETCFLQNGVKTKTGQNTGPVENGINVRFGLFANGLAGQLGIQGPANSNWKIRPARNVRMGQDQDEPPNKRCADYYPEAASTDGMALPRDPYFSTCGATCGNIGNGLWGSAEMTAYWAANTPSTVTAPTASQVLPGASGWGDVTRFDIYNYEISNPPPLTNEIGDGGEFGNPTMGAACYGGLPLAGDPVERRIINGAIVNCEALEAAGNNLNGQQSNVPVAAFAEFFVTEPVEKGGAGTAGDIYSEIVRVVVPGVGGNTTSLDQVQLYR